MRQQDLSDPEGVEAFDALCCALAELGYQGEISAELSHRIVYSTDNSIYQVLPQWVAIPATVRDVQVLVQANLSLGKPRSLTARGGGTGTNGQSLTDALLVDLSRLNRILEIDTAGRRVRVEPGVVLDTLNEAVASMGLFFAPHVSTSSRATLGGMVATDAAGKGSRLYGRTSRHVRALRAVLANGEVWTFEPLKLDAARELAEQDSYVGRLYRVLLDLLSTGQETIERRWPKVERGFSGYNLREALQDGIFNPIPLICGSEGTLALVTEVEVELEPLPEHRALVLVAYADFLTALREVHRLLVFDPAAVEAMDERTQNLGKALPVWGASVEDLPLDHGSCLYVEIVDQDVERFNKRLTDLSAWLEQHEPVRAYSVIRDPRQQHQMWRLRKDAAGLLARSDDGSGGRPQAFVEDCAVPAERMADFIADFRQLLDGHSLSYGMYGHADAGCVHVRPAVDFVSEGGRDRLRQVTDQVADLVARYGGVLWGEHGRGFRGEYACKRLGEDLYGLMLEVKRAFDPQGLFNPRKLYPVRDQDLPSIDEVPLRGERDRWVQSHEREGFETAFHCNGNGLCHHHASRELMCPSFKATGDYRQSPKGRADLTREWLRRWATGAEDPALTEALFESMQGCLSCKACSSKCPVEVDIPEMKSRFLEEYYEERKRPNRDFFLRQLEVRGKSLAPWGRWLNPLLRSRLAGWFGERLGVVDLPEFSTPSLMTQLRQRTDRFWNVADLQRLSAEEKERTVLLLPDAFTAFFDATTLIATYDLAAGLGYQPRMVELMPTGKFEHVKGYRPDFSEKARGLIARVRKLKEVGCPIVGVEPSIVLLFRQEYRELDARSPEVLLLQEWLSAIEPPLETLEKIRHFLSETPPTKQQLFLHCSESAALPNAGTQWQGIYERFGLDLEIVRAGCCGMAGIFGHEREHQQVSNKLFDLSWRDPLNARPQSSMASGFSCRSQTQRMLGRRIVHPVMVLNSILSSSSQGRRL